MGRRAELEYRPQVDYCTERATLCEHIARETEEARRKEFLFKLERLWRNVAASCIFRDQIKVVAMGWEEKVKALKPSDRTVG